MNSFLKYLLVAVVSFSLGVMAVMTVDTKNIAQEIPSTSPQTPAPRKPFFVKVKESGNKFLHSFSRQESDGSIQSAGDYKKLSAKLDEFGNKAFQELNKLFKVTDFNDKDLQAVRQKEHLKNSLEYMFSENELWYKAVIDDELLKTRTYLFFLFERCDTKKPTPGMPLKEICYQLDYSIIKNDKYSSTSASAGMSFILWNNDTPYVRLQFDGIGEMNEAANAIYAVVPVPNEELPIQFLEYNSGKFTWRKGSDVKWQLASKKELEKFTRWAEEEGYKHSDTYEE